MIYLWTKGHQVSKYDIKNEDPLILMMASKSHGNNSLPICSWCSSKYIIKITFNFYFPPIETHYYSFNYSSVGNRMW